MITVFIDELTPCLKNSATNELVKTQVVHVTNESYISQCNKRNGWYVNWSDLLSGNEVYALKVVGNNEIQGLVSLLPKKEYGAVFIAWMCAAPQNNPLIVTTPEYIGVGGHLFAIAAQTSYDYGFDGYLTGFAANMDLVQHYQKTFHAEHLGMLHEFQIAIDTNAANKILEVYDYDEITDENEI